MQQYFKIQILVYSSGANIHFISKRTNFRTYFQSFFTQASIVIIKKLCTPRHFRTSASGMHNTHFYSGTISVADIFTII